MPTKNKFKQKQKEVRFKLLEVGERWGRNFQPYGVVKLKCLKCGSFVGGSVDHVDFLSQYANPYCSKKQIDDYLEMFFMEEHLDSDCQHLQQEKLRKENLPKDEICFYAKDGEPYEHKIKWGRKRCANCPKILRDKIEEEASSYFREKKIKCQECNSKLGYFSYYLTKLIPKRCVACWIKTSSFEDWEQKVLRSDLPRLAFYHRTINLWVYFNPTHSTWKKIMSQREEIVAWEELIKKDCEWEVAYIVNKNKAKKQMGMVSDLKTEFPKLFANFQYK